MITPTSASQRIDNSLAFLSNPLLLLEKVTCRLVELSILLITILPLPIYVHHQFQEVCTSLMSEMIKSRWIPDSNLTLDLFSFICFLINCTEIICICTREDLTYLIRVFSNIWKEGRGRREASLFFFSIDAFWVFPLCIYGKRADWEQNHCWYYYNSQFSKVSIARI